MRLTSYDTPFSAAIPLALAIASAKLTEPEFEGLILLRSTFPELIGCGSTYAPGPGTGAELGYEGW